MRGGLAPVLEGHRLARVEARRPDLRFPLPRELRPAPDRGDGRPAGAARQIPAGPRWTASDTLVMHLGMSGRFEIAGPEGAEPARRVPLRARPRSQARPHRLRDRGRRAGHLLRPPPVRLHGLVTTATLDLHPWFAGLGPEPLSDDFDAGRLKAAFKGRKQGPKTLLLDQRIVAGLGNIYVCEALHRARISPFKPAGGISKPRLETLVDDDPRGAGRGDRGRRLDPARLRPGRRRAGLFPAPLPGL